MLDFIILALIGGIAISIITAILGNFMVWRRVSYLGDAIGHSSLLGIAIGVIFNNLSIFWVFLVCIIFAVTLVLLKQIYTFTFESLIVFNVQLFLSLGLILMGWFYISNGSTTISYLFGDLLLLTVSDTVLMFVLAIVVVSYITFFWRSLLLLTINQEIAYAENIKVVLNEIIFMALLAGNIAFLVKFVGVFLIPSLLIVPALIANYISTSPYKSFIVAGIATYLAIVIGLLASFIIDVAVTPLITLTIALEFIIIIIIKTFINNKSISNP